MNDFPRIDKTDVVVIAGKRGSGKSTLVKHILSTQLNEKNYLIYDVNREYGDFGFTLHSERSLTDLRKIVFPSDEPHVVYQPMTFGEKIHDVVSGAIMEKGNYFFVCEETDMYCSPRNVGEYFSRVLHVGRHYGVGVIAISRNVRGLNALVGSQAKHFFIFHTFFPQDKDYLSQFLHPDAMRKIDELKKFECLYFNSETSEFYIIPPLKN